MPRSRNRENVIPRAKRTSLCESIIETGCLLQKYEEPGSLGDFFCTEKNSENSHEIFWETEFFFNSQNFALILQAVGKPSELTFKIY